MADLINNLNIKKYPRTYHFPFSPGKGSDDKVNYNWQKHLENKEIIYTEKLDGGNTQINRESIFARSINQPSNHPTFDYLKAWHASIKHELGNLIIFGENLKGIHSIEYANLDSFFYIFAIKDGDNWLSWNEVEFWAKYFNFPTVPVLNIYDKLNIEQNICLLMQSPSMFGDIKEGIVVRNKNSFPDNEFSSNVFKYVRANHVQTDKHWSNNYKEAKLKE